MLELVAEECNSKERSQERVVATNFTSGHRHHPLNQTTELWTDERLESPRIPQDEILFWRQVDYNIHI